MRYLAVYKDNTTAKVHYFGPFVSIQVADEFLSDLPTPERGGAKGVKVLSPYTSTESTLARDAILRARDKTHPHNVAVNAIVARTKRPSFAQHSQSR